MPALVQSKQGSGSGTSLTVTLSTATTSGNCLVVMAGAVTYLNNQDSIQSTPPRTLNATDTPHRVSISGNWALPFFSHTHGFLATLVKDWQLDRKSTRLNS